MAMHLDPRAGATAPAAPTGPAARPALPATTLAIGAVAVAALIARDPHATGSWGSCPVLTATGLPCPFCGGLRAVHDLGRGDLAGALGSNALAVLFVVAALTVTIWWLVAELADARAGRASRGVTLLDRLPWGWLLTALFGGWLIFGVLRLFPPFTGLQP